MEGADELWGQGWLMVDGMQEFVGRVATAGGGYLVEEENWEGVEGGAENGGKKEGDR